jgi:hypothetical protein
VLGEGREFVDDDVRLDVLDGFEHSVRIERVSDYFLGAFGLSCGGRIRRANQCKELVSCAV